VASLPVRPPATSGGVQTTADNEDVFVEQTVCSI
jgi:hypothetical protein